MARTCWHRLPTPAHVPISKKTVQHHARYHSLLHSCRVWPRAISKQLLGYQHLTPTSGTAAVPLVMLAEPMRETKRTSVLNAVPAPS